ncbi:hypothetical protein P9112_013131 [Eukaryota sp. TZLM1-RC]
MPRHKFHLNEPDLLYLHRKGVSLDEAARLLGCTRQCVTSRCKTLGLFLWNSGDEPHSPSGMFSQQVKYPIQERRAISLPRDGYLTESYPQHISETIEENPIRPPPSPVSAEQLHQRSQSVLPSREERSVNFKKPPKNWTTSVDMAKLETSTCPNPQLPSRLSRSDPLIAEEKLFHLCRLPERTREQEADHRRRINLILQNCEASDLD